MPISHRIASYRTFRLCLNQQLESSVVLHHIFLPLSSGSAVAGGHDMPLLPTPVSKHLFFHLNQNPPTLLPLSPLYIGQAFIILLSSSSVRHDLDFHRRISSSFTLRRFWRRWKQRNMHAIRLISSMIPAEETAAIIAVVSWYAVECGDGEWLG